MESFKLIEPPKTEMQRPEINTDIKSETETTTPVVKTILFKNQNLKRKMDYSKDSLTYLKKQKKRI